MSTQMIVRMDPGLKKKLAVLARTEGKTSSQMVRELVEGYVKEHDIAAYIDGLWTRTGAKLKKKGASAADVQAAIKAVRKIRG